MLLRVLAVVAVFSMLVFVPRGAEALDLRMRAIDLSFGPREAMLFLGREKKATITFSDDTVSLQVTPRLGTMHDTAWQRMLVALAFAPAAFMWQVLLHEGSHALVAESLGHDIVLFKPYPHMYADHLYFGRIGVSPTISDNNAYAAFLLAPAAMDMMVFTISDMVLESQDRMRTGKLGTLLFLFGMIAPMVDFSVGFFAGSDWRRVREMNGSAMVVTCIGASLMAIGSWRIIDRAEKMYFR